MIHEFEMTNSSNIDVGVEVDPGSVAVDLFVIGEPYENAGFISLTAAEAFKLSTELFRAALKIKRHEDNKENN